MLQIAVLQIVSHAIANNKGAPLAMLNCDDILAEDQRAFGTERRLTTTASIENQPPPDGYSIYEARALAAGAAFCLTAAIKVFAAGPEEAGFCPVISKPSLTT